MSEPGPDVARRDAASGPGSRLRSPIVRRGGFAVGLVLLIAAAVYLLSDPGTLGELWNHVRHAPAWATIVVVLGPFFNWILVGLCLHALMRRCGRVGVGEMLALVGSAWLLNHLPMRPGLVGRIGYHAKVNRIRVRDSIGASVWSMVHAAIANGVALGVVLMLPSGTSTPGLVLALLTPVALVLMAALVIFPRNAGLGFLLLGLVYRQGDLLVWMGRYGAAFTMLGLAMSPLQIVLITAASQIAQAIPITGGGLGFREWGVGLAARMTSRGASVTMRTAVGADLINRAAETMIVIPLGLISAAIVARRFSKHARAATEGSGAGSAEDQPAGDPQQQDDPREPGEQDPSDQ